MTGCRAECARGEGGERGRARDKSSNEVHGCVGSEGRKEALFPLRMRRHIHPADDRG